MPDWTYNTLTVSGSAAFLEAVKGIDDEGAPRALSLGSIDPMPPEYLNRTRWSDSHEFAELKKRFEELSETSDKVDFIDENRGFAAVMMAPGLGLNPDDEEGWFEWRLQHWGTKWDLPAGEISLKLTRDGRKATFECVSASGDIAPAVATAARRFPDLEFTLRSKDGVSGKAAVCSWRGGERAT